MCSSRCRWRSWWCSGVAASSRRWCAIAERGGLPGGLGVLLGVGGGAPPRVRERGAGRWPGLELRRGRSLAALGICLLTAGMGLYSAVFTAFLLVAGGGWASLRRRSLHPVVAGVA